MTCLERILRRNYVTVNITIPTDLYLKYQKENQHIEDIRAGRSPRIIISKLASEALRLELEKRGLLNDEEE